MEPVLLLSDYSDLFTLLIQLAKLPRISILNKKGRENPFALENMREQKLNIDWKRKFLIGWANLIHCGIKNETISQNGLSYVRIYLSYFFIMGCHVWHGKFFILPIYCFLYCIISHLWYSFINKLKRAYSWLNKYKSTVPNCNNYVNIVYCFCLTLHWNSCIRIFILPYYS